MVTVEYLINSCLFRRKASDTAIPEGFFDDPVMDAKVLKECCFLIHMSVCLIPCHPNYNTHWKNACKPRSIAILGSIMSHPAVCKFFILK